MNPQEVAKKIKQLAAKKNISINKMLADCKLGKNTIGKLSNGGGISLESLSKIADYLNCSLDYILDRNDSYPQTVNLFESKDIRKFNAFGKEIDDLSEAEIELVSNYIDFLKNQRKK